MRIFYETHIKFFLVVCLCFSTVCFSGMEGCNEAEEPAVFVSATPREGSTIREDRTILVTFDTLPEGLEVSGGQFKLSGANVIITGPFEPGKVALFLTWTGGAQVLTYTVTGPSDDASTRPSDASTRPSDEPENLPIDDEPENLPIDDEPENLPIDPSLILSLSFDERQGRRVIDGSLYGNHGSLIGNPRFVKGVGHGNALELDGQNDWVEVPHDETLTVDEDVTVMAWIRTPRHGGPRGARWQGILAKSNNPRSYSFYTESGGRLHLSAGGGSDSTHQVPLNRWVHVVAQVDSGVHRYWINGRNRGNFNVNAELPGGADRATVRIGNTQEGFRTFLGSIDEVRIWNRALREDEILEQMDR